MRSTTFLTTSMDWIWFGNIQIVSMLNISLDLGYYMVFDSMISVALNLESLVIDCIHPIQFRAKKWSNLRFPTISIMGNLFTNSYTQIYQSTFIHCSTSQLWDMKIGCQDNVLEHLSW